MSAAPAQDRSVPSTFSCRPERSLGRRFPEPESALRTAFQRDRDRIIHSTAFRRLKHKTQVFVAPEGDHYRTRLTHSIEVAQIARTIARALGLNEDLAEALALAHDLGHTPFGHAGEDALDAAMAEHGGFDHNAQTLRIVTRLEQRYAAFDGLNLTWETLEGVVKHNGPLLGPLAVREGRPIAAAILEYNAAHDLALDSFASAEAQVASLSDDIAYNSHDIDDGLRAGLFTLDEMVDIPIAGKVFREAIARHKGIERPRLIGEAIRRLIDMLVTDLLAETRRRLAALGEGGVERVRRAQGPVAGFSEEIVAATPGLREFLFRRMYRHERVTRTTQRAQTIVSELFAAFWSDASLLPEDWSRRAQDAEPKRRARLIADYIAGMTDQYAQREHRRLLSPSEAIP
jgi:dGTPase